MDAGEARPDFFPQAIAPRIPLRYDARECASPANCAVSVV
jgi:hypothetical protein